MTDLLLQAKTRLLEAELAFNQASDKLNIVMLRLEEAKKESAEAQKNFETKTLNYSLAIQHANTLELQPHLSEKALITANHDLDVAKKAYDAAQMSNQTQKSNSQTAFYAVVQAQATYDETKLELDGATYDYERILRERKLPLIGEDEFAEQDETPPENIDFLVNFLNQYPLPDYTQNNGITTDDATGIIYDSSIPFEKRPALDGPLPFENQPPIDKAASETLRTGHITWDFDSPNQPDNEMEH
ncbi:hypothetical protein [Pseudolactococcus reticulitermitis]|uniref:Uncharacterized protein n=1 Tax=Pseudolactococcus reticulitermitis TaxID=2025039 RepID=A0A224XEB1_9LACT|nr:hypothetical protein [Lactococcus reticulitermitis]GAX47975.1 hypothetical protein RsY01_1589 [Lactococcus reticulitermitis]